MVSESRFSVDRLLAITDGVYAIVITLLVLDLKVPEFPGPISSQELAADLIDQIPNFFAYIISFIIVAFFWMNHHRLFASLKECDQRTLLLNLVHILFISLIPYATSLVGRYEEDQIATILFSVNIGLATFSTILLYGYVSAKTEWHVDEDDVLWAPQKWWTVYFGPLLAIACIAVSFVSTALSLVLWLLLPLRNTYLLRWLSRPN